MKKKDQPLDLVVKKEEKAAGRFKRARGLKALASDKSEGWIYGYGILILEHSCTTFIGLT